MQASPKSNFGKDKGRERGGSKNQGELRWVYKIDWPGKKGAPRLGPVFIQKKSILDSVLSICDFCCTYPETSKDS